MAVAEVMEKERGRGERGEMGRDREGAGNCRERGRVPLHAVLLYISDYPQPSRMRGEREGQNTPGHPERAPKESMVDISHHHSASSHTAAFSPKQCPPEGCSCQASWSSEQDVQGPAVWTELKRKRASLDLSSNKSTLSARAGEGLTVYFARKPRCPSLSKDPCATVTDTVFQGVN